MRKETFVLICITSLLAECVLLYLKIIGSITTPWVWVAAPIWAPFICSIVVFCFFAIFFKDESEDINEEDEQ